MDLVTKSGRNRCRVLEGEGLEIQQDLSTSEKYMKLITYMSTEEVRQLRDWLTTNFYLMEKRDASAIE